MIVWGESVFFFSHSVRIYLFSNEFANEEAENKTRLIYSLCLILLTATLGASSMNFNYFFFVISFRVTASGRQFSFSCGYSSIGHSLVFEGLCNTRIICAILITGTICVILWGIRPKNVCTWDTINVSVLGIMAKKWGPRMKYPQIVQTHWE